MKWTQFVKGLEKFLHLFIVHVDVYVYVDGMK